MLFNLPYGFIPKVGPYSSRQDPLELHQGGVGAGVKKRGKVDPIFFGSNDFDETRGKDALDIGLSKGGSPVSRKNP